MNGNRFIVPDSLIVVEIKHVFRELCGPMIAGKRGRGRSLTVEDSRFAGDPYEIKVNDFLNYALNCDIYLGDSYNSMKQRKYEDMPLIIFSVVTSCALEGRVGEKEIVKEVRFKSDDIMIADSIVSKVSLMEKRKELSCLTAKMADQERFIKWLDLCETSEQIAFSLNNKDILDNPRWPFEGTFACIYKDETDLVVINEKGEPLFPVVPIRENIVPQTLGELVKLIR